MTAFTYGRASNVDCGGVELGSGIASSSSVHSLPYVGVGKNGERGVAQRVSSRQCAHAHQTRRFGHHSPFAFLACWETRLVEDLVKDCSMDRLIRSPTSHDRSHLLDMLSFVYADRPHRFMSALYPPAGKLTEERQKSGELLYDGRECAVNLHPIVVVRCEVRLIQTISAEGEAVFCNDVFGEC